MVSHSVPTKALYKPESIETLRFLPSSSLTLSGNGGQLPKDRYMTGLIIQYRGRITNAGSGNPTGTNAGGMFNLIDRVRVYGKHRFRRSDDTIIDLSGVNLAQLELVYTRVAPVTSGSLSTSASATQDISFAVFIPFTPMAVSPIEVRNHLLDAPNYDTLYCKIDTGAYGSVFSGHSTAGTFSAFGSASGDGVINVMGIYASEPSTNFSGFIPGYLSRYSKDSIAGVMNTTNSKSRILDVPKGSRLRGLLLKTGTLQTGLGTLRAFASLSDDLLTNIVLNRGTNRRVWDSPNFQMARSLAKITKGVSPETGYLLMDWVNTGDMSQSFSTNDMVAGATGEVDFYLEAQVAGASNQIAELIVEERVQPPSYLQAA